MNVFSRNSLITACALASTVALAGCGGGGSTPAPIVAKNPGAPSASAQRYAVTVNFVTKSGAGTAASTVRGGRKRHYISPATLGATIVATSTDNAANNATFGFDLSTSNPNCTYVPANNNTLRKRDSTQDSIICTLAFALAADTYTIALTTYDSDQSQTPGTGTALSIDSESETIAASSTNTITLNPEPYVAGFDFVRENVDDAVARYGAPTVLSAVARAQRASHARAKRQADGLDDVAVGAAPVFGFDGDSDDDICCIEANALDRDYYVIGDYPGLANFANGTFAPTVTEEGDGTGCSSATPCSQIEGVYDFGNVDVTQPTYVADQSSPLTIAQATEAQQDFYVHYLGGGGVGTGITAWTVGTTPTGLQPFYSDIAIPNATGGSYGTVTPYLVPHAYLAPLFPYSTDGAGNAATTTGNDGGELYVWAAQAKLPTAVPTDGSGYGATFDASGNSQCSDGNADVVMTIGSPTYYAGYGAVFPISVTPAFETQCVVDLYDDYGDQVSVTLSSPDAEVIESHKRGSVFVRARAGIR